MKPVARLFVDKGQFWFDVVDESDTITVGDDVLPELLFTSKKGYTREGSAESAADRAIAGFIGASEANRRKLCGYDTATQCRTRKAKAGRVGNRNTPVRN